MKRADEEELAVIAEIARMYYVEGMSQQEIANMLFFSKAKVSRALKIAREEKIVEFQIHYPLKQSVLLETELKRRFGLKEALVVTDLYDNQDAEIAIKRIGEMAAGYLDRILEDGDAVGLSWGRTIYQMVRQLKPSVPRKLEIVQLVGNATEEYLSQKELPVLVQEMARAFQARYSLLYAPLYIENDIVRKELMKERIIRTALEKAKKVQYVVTGIADMKAGGGVNTWEGYLTPRKKEELIRKGAVGYLCGYFFDREGKKINDRLNDWIIGIPFEDLQQVPQVIALAGGWDKTQAIYAAIKGNLIDCLITDSRIAEKLIEQERSLDG